MQTVHDLVSGIMLKIINLRSDLKVYAGIQKKITKKFFSALKKIGVLAFSKYQKLILLGNFSHDNTATASKNNTT